MGSPKDAAKKFVEAYALFDYDTADNYSLVSFDDYCQALGFEDRSASASEEWFESVYGDVDEAEIKIKKVEVKKTLDSKKVKKIKKILGNKKLKLDINTDKISAIKVVKVRYKIDGDKKDYSGTWNIRIIYKHFYRL